MSAPHPDAHSVQDTADLELQNGSRSSRLSAIREVSEVVETVVNLMGELGYSAKDIFGARLALEEAVVNAIKHGHQHDPSKQVMVRYKVGPEYVLVSVEDQGPGFDPTDVPDPTDPENIERPNGRGLFLIQNCTSWVRFNERGNCITFCKYATVPPVSS